MYFYVFIPKYLKLKVIVVVKTLLRPINLGSQKSTPDFGDKIWTQIPLTGHVLMISFII